MNSVEKQKKRKHYKWFGIVLFFGFFLFLYLMMPKLTFVKKNTILEKGVTYDALSLVASSNGQVIPESNVVDTQKIGTYDFTYTVKKWLFSKEVVLHYEVIDTTPPDLKVIKESVELKQGVSYTRQDVLRNIDFDEGEIEYQSDIDEQFPGTYRVYVTATDESGNRSEISYEVFIKDSEAPTVLNYGDGAMILRGEEFDISDLRTYADSFFTIRRRRIKDDTPISEFTESIEVFHQALLFRTVSEQAYTKIRGKLGSFKERLESGNEYQFIENDLMSQLRGIPFVRTEAFEEMLSGKSRFERIVNLQTLCDMNRDIVKRYAEHLLAETWLTGCMSKLCEETGTGLKGLRARIKSPASLYGKLYERNDKEGKTPEELFISTYDIIRYTVCFDDPSDYCRGTEDYIKKLIVLFPGSKLERFRNYWVPYVSNQYKGINTVIRLPDLCYDRRTGRLADSSYRSSRSCTPIRSICFEVQFHTADSLKIKEYTHPLYEKLRNHNTTDEERAEILLKMEKANKPLEELKSPQVMSMVSNEYIEAMKALRKHLDRTLDSIRDNAGTCLADTSALQ